MTLIEVHSTTWRARAATIVGRAHARRDRGPQDAWCVVNSWRGGVSAASRAVVAVVCDGCSAGERSDVGAGLGARFLAAACARRYLRATPAEQLPSAVIADLVEELRRIVRACAVSEQDAVSFVESHLLFTAQVAVLDGDRALVFGVGDGIVVVDDDTRVIDQGDAPDYPAYALFPIGELRAPRVLVHHDGSVARRVLLATDGARELRDLAAMVDDPRVAHNPSWLEKQLRAHEPRPEDDCTVVVLDRTDAAQLAGDATPAPQSAQHAPASRWTEGTCA